MKTLPKYPYFQNIVTHYRETHECEPIRSIGKRRVGLGTPHYRNWLEQFGFKVPVREDLEFPDDFDEKELMLFILRWA
jgi:hypothetical protein